ncbi:MAG: filamentous hemagglutinin N-terminal domain-containing protein [Burkholderiales bacterium]
MRRRRPEANLKPKLLAVSVAACFALHAASLRANPTGPTVVHGSVGFSGLGTSSLTITNQSVGNAIINWNGFSIGVDELTRFAQFANLAVLNRVTGSELSSILGSLQSDGRVFLINPNGIVFGASARIDVAGLVASSLNLSDQDFLANRLHFTEVPGAGAVLNNGVIETAAGGRVYLVAPTVENNGLITSPQGAIVLAAGKEVELVDAASPLVTVKVAAQGQAVNVGELVAQGGSIGMFGTLVRNSGVVEAGGAVAGPGGDIRLVAAKDLEVGGTVSASGTSGGRVLLQAEGGTNLIDGTVEAKGSSGKGGSVSALGVRVGVVGYGVIDASGETGGGTVLVGGDYQGRNAEVQNAQSTLIGRDGVIRADAMTAGDGGRVIVWADRDTRFYGDISAKGAAGGVGGVVETSGKDVLEAFGSVAVGKGGTWLLDPGFINIVASNNGPDDSQLVSSGALDFFYGGPPPATSTVGVNSIDSAMGSFGLVQLQAVQDITLQTNLTLTNPGNLTLQAGDNIHLGTHSINMRGDLNLIANDFLAQQAYGAVPTTGAITSSPGGGNITTNGGSLNASGVSVALGNINTSDTTSLSDTSESLGNGNVWISSTTGNIVTGSITTRSLHPVFGDGGDVVLITDTGTITVNGTIDTRGADGSSIDPDTCGDGCVGNFYYSGTAGGMVALGRGAEDGFAGNAIVVNGNIFASGGKGLTASSYGGDGFDGGEGGFVSFGGNCDGPCVYGPANGNFVVTGVINTMGGSGGASLDNADSYVYGGTGGGVYAETSGNILFGAVDARGGNAGGGGGSFGGSNHGGDGGSVEIYAGAGGATIGWIDSSGGAGGAGGSGFFDANGGSGGAGGQVTAYGYGAITVGTIVSRGGAGGVGGTSSGLGYGAVGGEGGGGGYVELRSDAAAVSLIAVDTAGGAAGNGGSAYGGTANGGNGGDGGSVYLQGSTGVSVTASVVTRGGRGGHGATASGNRQAEGEVGGDGGSINLYSYYGNVSVASFVDSSGGAGGNGGLADSVGAGANDASGGDGGEAGYVQFTGSQGSVTIGAILARGGVGGAGGTATGGDPQAQNFTEAQGGDGGGGYAVYLYAGNGALKVGNIDASGAQGGAGGTSMDASGGNGGDSAYSVQLYGASVDAGEIVVHGGAGGAGGIAQTDYGDASGGPGGWGGSVYVETGGVSAGDGPVTTGMVDVSGGNGANSGPAGTSSSRGGDGGDGGYVSYYGSTISIKGPVFARGGDGGDMVNSSILSSLGGSPDGGSAGSGGSVNLQGSGEVQVNVGGAVGAVAIDAGGGTGGSGHPAASPAGNGGAGGSGGFIDVVGTPNMTLFGSLNAAGGTGGAGGAGSASVAGGNGGAGGSAGAVFLDASSATGTQTGDGIIFVLAGSSPFFGTSISGGAGGAGGADGGAGSGIPGADGSSSSFLSGSDYFGTIVILDPLAIPEVNQGFQQVVEGNDDAVAFVGGEKEEEEEDKSQKEFGSCKG